MKNQTVKLWIDLAQSDLQSARLLHENKHYRTSYSLFQQATEKANKAYWLYLGLATEADLYTARHDQFKLLRKKMVDSQKEVVGTIEALKTVPQMQHPQFSNLLQSQKYHDWLQNSISFIDSLKQKDLMRLSSTELNYFLKQFNDSYFLKVVKLDKLSSETNSFIREMADWMESFKTPEAMKAKQQLEEFIKDKSKQAKVYKMINKVLSIVVDFAFVFLTLYVCALITTQHSSKTRYPKDGFNPIKAYTSRLPLIKKQPDFMALLEVALKKMSKFDKAKL